MSHLVSIQTQVRDPVAVTAACTRLKLSAPVNGTIRLFSAQETGLAVQLPGWKYPIVCQTQTGDVKFDNFNGRWGNPAELDRFIQAYAVEKAKIEARREGHSVTEQQLPDGSIRVQIAVASGTS